MPCDEPPWLREDIEHDEVDDDLVMLNNAGMTTGD